MPVHSNFPRHATIRIEVRCVFAHLSAGADEVIE
jgi:hypothetical protein